MKHTSTRIDFEDKNGALYSVVFKGQHGDLQCLVYKNDSFIGSCRQPYGHANKTQAKKAIEFVSKK